MADRKVRQYTPTSSEPEPPGWAKAVMDRWHGPYTPAPLPTPEMGAGPSEAPLSPSARRLGEPLPCGHTPQTMNDFCDGWYGRPCPPKVSTELQAKELKAKRAAQGISADGKFKVADMAVTIADVTNPTPTPVATSKVAPIKDPVQRAALGLAANANIRRAYDLDES